MEMRRSRVLQKLRQREVVSCFKVNSQDPRICEIAALAGFDCLWIDQEHIAPNWQTLSSAIWAGKANNTDVMVRVPRGSYSNYIWPLEMDATGILVPHITSLMDAKEVIDCTRFFPEGHRAVDGGNADGRYSMMDFQAYIEQANRERFIALQIEDPEAVAELDEISALEGYDMLFFGPADFSVGIGAPGQWNHPQLVAARKAVASAARQHDKSAGTVGTKDNLQELLSMGYNFVNIGSDTSVLRTHCLNLRNDFRNLSMELRSDLV